MDTFVYCHNDLIILCSYKVGALAVANEFGRVQIVV